MFQVTSNPNSVLNFNYERFEDVVKRIKNLREIKNKTKEQEIWLKRLEEEYKWFIEDAKSKKMRVPSNLIVKV